MIKACRACGAALGDPVLDLGDMPAANGLSAAAHEEPIRYPLRLRACSVCTLLQTDAAVPPEALFTADYPYFSSFSPGFVRHAGDFVATCIRDFDLSRHSFVLEAASNDGYLLQHCVKAGIPCLGVEPTAAAAAAARGIGVPTEQAFFGRATAERLRTQFSAADLVIANNVIAHVPDLNDFAAGLAFALAPHGVLSVEFQHLLPMLRDCGFDPVYHEHYSYFSLHALERLYAAHGLRVFDVHELNVHTGSLRVLASRDARPVHPRVAAMRAREAEIGFAYDDLAGRAAARIAALRGFVREMRRLGRTVAVYGAAAKAVILLNACRLNFADIVCVIDKNPHKQGRFIPGCGIPIVAPHEAPPHDLLLIAVRNLVPEVLHEVHPERAFVALPNLLFVC